MAGNSRGHRDGLARRASIDDAHERLLTAERRQATQNEQSQAFYKPSPFAPGHQHPRPNTPVQERRDPSPWTNKPFYRNLVAQLNTIADTEKTAKMNSAWNDPSEGVYPQLLPHLACVSNYRFPTSHRLSPEMIVNYLSQAPQIVKQVQPMHWEYLNAPPDGTLLLCWAAPRMGEQFVSDGYVWADVEAKFQQTMGDYLVEIWVHRSGYRVGEQVALHQRFRYRIVNRDPAQAQLWLIHWSPCEQQFRFPVQNIPMTPQVTLVFQQRRWIEQQGQLYRKEFMLHDRANWPQVQIPPRQQIPTANPMAGQVYPGGAPQHMAVNMARPYYQQQQAALAGAIQPPQAKRPRRDQGPVGAVPVQTAVDHVMIEEDTEFGDYLDNITPRELSLMRYKQHHEWMEEVLGSTYPAYHILPIELGLGLAGGLEEVTKGIFDPPNWENLTNPEKGQTLVKPYQKLSPEKAEELEKRIEQFNSDGQAELERMKQAHASLLADVKKSKKYMHADRKLSEAMRAGNDLDGVIKDVEKAFEIKITPQKEVVCVDKGGLLEKEEPKPTQQLPNGRNTPLQQQNGAINGARSMNYSMQSGMSQPGTGLSGLSNMTQANLPHSGTPTPTTAQNQTPQPQQPQQPEPQPSMDDAGMDLLDVDGMDLDIDMSALQDTDTGLDPTGSKDTNDPDSWVMVNQDTPNNIGTPTTQPPLNQTPAAEQAKSTPGATTTAADTTAGIFDSADFGSFGDMDTAGDALADYGGADDLDLGLDGSAFGEAFVGTEGHREGVDGA